MKWNKLFLIKLSPDKVINESATTYRKYYSIPASDRFVPASESTKPDKDWSILTEGSLSRITLQDKLFIVAHGSSTQVADCYSPKMLANELKGWGLEEVGLITFKCCFVGRADFLEQFVAHAGNKCLIKIGWTKGYRGEAQTWLGGAFKPFEKIKNQSSPGYKGGEARYKIVPGLASMSIPNSRYTIADALGDQDD